MGYLHDEDHFGVVYDLKSLDTVSNFIAEGIVCFPSVVFLEHKAKLIIGLVFDGFREELELPPLPLWGAVSYFCGQYSCYVFPISSKYCRLRLLLLSTCNYTAIFSTNNTYIFRDFYMDGQDQVNISTCTSARIFAWPDTSVFGSELFCRSYNG